MSLIRARKIRKRNWLEPRKGMAVGRLLVLLGLTVAAIWYLGWRF